MQPQLVLNKTAQGLAEVEQRSLALTTTLRRLLITVDGHRTVAALMHDNAAAFDVAGALEHLLSLGLVSSSADASLGAEHVDNCANATPREALIHMTEALLGSLAATKVTAKLRSAPDEGAELQRAVDACSRLIHLTIDETKASDFRQQAGIIISHKGLLDS